MAVTLPLIVMLYDFLFSPQDNEKSEFMPLKPRYLGYFLVLALYLWVRLFLMRNPGVTEAAYPGGNLYTNILTMCKVFASYAQWIIFPLNIHLTLPDDPALISRSLFEPAALFSIALIIFMLALAFRLRKTARAVSFAILWFFITLLPVSNILPLANYMASRYLYIPLVGFCLLSSVILVNLPELKIFAFRPQALRRAARNTAVILILSYGAITIIKNMSWKNDTVFWMEMVENYPANALAHSNLANQFGKSGLFREAIREYAIALKLDPRYAMDYNSLGSCYYAIGMPDEALKYFNKALELDPRLPDAITNLGVISGDRGLYREAIKYFEAAIRADPRFIPAYNNLGITYAKMGENQKAQKIWGQALKIIPDSQEVQENLRKLRMAGH
jgi:tetratricopeptide (TPR) repeat protein